MYFVCRLKKMNTIKQLTTDLAVATKKKADADAAIAAAEKQKMDTEKKRADVVRIEISCPEGLVARCICQIPIAAVIQLGLYRMLEGSAPVVTNILNKIPVEDYGPIEDRARPKILFSSVYRAWSDKKRIIGRALAEPYR